MKNVNINYLIKLIQLQQDSLSSGSKISELLCRFDRSIFEMNFLFYFPFFFAAFLRESKLPESLLFDIFTITSIFN